MADTPLCPRCGHAPSQHYAGCMQEMPEKDTYYETGYCGCDEQFNLATGIRLPNRAELISMLERAAEKLADYCACATYGDMMNDPLAMEIKRKLKGE